MSKDPVKGRKLHSEEHFPRNAGLRNFPEPPLGLTIHTSASVFCCLSVSTGQRPSQAVTGDCRKEAGLHTLNTDTRWVTSFSLTPGFLRCLWWKIKPRLLIPGWAEEET